MDDLLEDLRRFIRENPIDYTECDVAWGGSQKGNNYWEGCHHTEETKAYLSEIMSGEGNPFYGKRHTEETRQKMREAAKRRSQTDFAEKQRAALCVNNHYKFLNPEGEPVIINDYKGNPHS